jgi:hypothetical protein
MDLLAALPEETLRLVTGAGVPIQDRRLPRPVLGAFLDRYAPDAGGTRMELRLRLRETEPITVHPEWRCSFWVLEILARRGASQVLVATHRTDVPAALYRIPAASPTREDVR